MNAQKSRLLRSAVIIGGLLLALCVVGYVYAGTVVIDTFNYGNENYTVGPGDSDSATYDGSEILGGERDSEVYAYGDDITFRVDRNNNDRLTIAASPGATYTTTVTWDGNDNNATSLDPTGLGGVNLISGTNDGFLMTIVFKDDGIVGLTLRVYTGTNSSALTVAMPAARVATGERVDMFYPFSQFTTTAGSGASFTSAGAIQLYFDGTIAEATDIAVDNLVANNAREYGDLPESIYGTTVLSACHVPKGLRLGYNCDAESFYNESTGADGDDNNQYPPDDEDGVAPSNLPWVAGVNGGQLTIRIQGCSGCYVNGWIDWDNDGNLTETIDGAPERVVNNYYRTEDTTGVTYAITTPTSFSRNWYYARFRICKTNSACNDPTNTLTDVDDGEVEDYRWWLGPTVVTLASFTANWDGDGVLVEWQTTAEVNTVGFNVWRSTAPDGDYVKVNDAVIPSAVPGGVGGGSYSYTDASVTPGTTYYYKLEELEVGGASYFYGPGSTGGGGGTTSVTLSTVTAGGWDGLAFAWWPLVGAAAVGAGVAALAHWRRRR